MLVVVVYDGGIERRRGTDRVQKPCGLVPELGLDGLQTASMKDKLELGKVSKPDHKCIRTKRRTHQAFQVFTPPLLNGRIHNFLNIVSSPQELPPP